jgi:hypothetical protein
MNTATLTDIVPKRGAENDRSVPEKRAAWLNQRRGGFTATDARDWGYGSKRRAIITEKVTGEWDAEEAASNRYYEHGIHREPIIMQWVEDNFGISPCGYVYSHGANPRHLASPDGVSLDPFTGALIVGTSDAALAEVKTTTEDLTPGPLDDGRVLLRITRGSAFDKMNYYTQIQWQMYVMNAAVTLFVWEEHESKVDPETGHFSPTAPPQWCWIPRDQEFIDYLVDDLSVRALAEIDAARVGLDDMPPASDLPTEQAILVAQLLAARDAEAVAAAAKKKAWDALVKHYVTGGPDEVIDAGFAQITVSTTHGVRHVVDEEGMRRLARDRALIERYEALREKHTKPEPYSKQALYVKSRDV